MRALSRRDTIVAYLSLFFGAGLSVGANLADTLRIRGDLVDVIDVALAVGPPLAALLVVELFVSEWPRSWSVQSVRWVATLIVGTLATIVSWIHIHELLAARGQNPYVAMLWPVAIDGLAIMAMAKLLVTRGHVQDPGQPGLANSGQPGQANDSVAIVATRPTGQTERELVKATGQDPGLDFGGRPEPLATQPDDPTIDVRAELARWAEGYDRAVDDLAKDIPGEAERFLAGVQTATPPVIEKIPDEARDLIARMTALNARPGEIDQSVAEMCEVSSRQARRWRSALKSREDS